MDRSGQTQKRVMNHRPQIGGRQILLAIAPFRHPPPPVVDLQAPQHPARPHRCASLRIKVAWIVALPGEWEYLRNLQEILPRNISAGHQHRREARDGSEVDGIHLQMESKDTSSVKTDSLTQSIAPSHASNPKSTCRARLHKLSDTRTHVRHTHSRARQCQHVPRLTRRHAQTVGAFRSGKWREHLHAQSTGAAGAMLGWSVQARGRHTRQR